MLMKKKHFIIVVTILIIIVVFLVVDLHLSNEDVINEDVILDQLNQRQIIHIDTICTSIENAIQTRSMGIKALSNFSAIQYFEQPLINQRIEERYAYLKEKAVESVSVFDSTGTIVFSTNPEFIGTNHIQSDFWPWLKKPENNGRVSLSTHPDTFAKGESTSGRNEPHVRKIPQSFDELPKSSYEEQKDTTIKPLRIQIVTPIYQDLKDEKHPYPSRNFIGALSVLINFQKMLQQSLSYLRLGNVRTWVIDSSDTLLYNHEKSKILSVNTYRQKKICENCLTSFDYNEKIIKEKTGSTKIKLKNKPERFLSYDEINFENFSWIIGLTNPAKEVTYFLGKSLLEMILLLFFLIVAPCGISIFLYRTNREKNQIEKDAHNLKNKQELEEKIRQLEEKYRTIVETSHDIIWKLDHRCNFTFINKQGENIIGQNAADCIGKSFLSLVHTEDIQLVREILNNALSGNSRSYTLRIYDKEKNIIILSVNTISWYEQNNIVGTISFGREITKLKELEDALRESEDCFTVFMNNSPFVAWIKDPTTWTFNYINNTFEQVFNITREEISKKTDLDLWPEEVAQQLRENDMKVISSDKTIQTFEDVPLPDGTTHHWLVFKFPLHTPSGKRLLAGTSIDITERKRAEEEIQKRNKELSILYKIERLASQSLDIEEILKDSTQTVMQTMKIDACGIHLIEPDNETLSLKIHKGFSDEFVNNIRHIKLGEGISGKAAAGKKPIVINISEYTTEQLAPFIIYEGFQTLASTPLLSGWEPIGALTMGTLRPHAFQPEQLDLLNSIGIQIGTAVRNAQLYQNLQAELALRKCAEREILQQKENFQQLFESSPDAIALLDITDKVVIVNKSFKKLFQYSLDEIRNKYLKDLIVPEDRAQEYISLLNRIVNEKTFHTEAQCQRKDGSLVDVSIVSYPIIIDKQHVGFYAIYTDITERKRVENAIRKSEMQFRLVWENSADGMRLIDEHGAIVAVNEAFCRMVGKNKEELEGKPFSIIYEKKQQANIQKQYHERFILRTMGPYFVREQILWDGRKIWFEISNSFFEFEGQVPMLISIFRDITARKLLEKELINSNEQLHALTSRLQNVREEERLKLSRELHDNVGQILTALQMDVSFLENNIIGRNRKINPKIIKEKFNGMTQLIDSCTDIIREISIKLRPNILDLFGLISTIEWHLKEFQKKSGIVCTFVSELKKIKIDPHISIVAYRIFQEALTNIIRHSQATLVEVQIKKLQNKIILEIKDNGIGISNDALQNANSLGLLGMRERALSINGTVTFSGIPGKGTMVVISIPINPPSVD